MIDLFVKQLDKKVSKIDNFLNQLIEALTNERDKRKQLLFQIFGLIISMFGINEVFRSILVGDLEPWNQIVSTILLLIVAIISAFLLWSYWRKRKYF